MPDITLKTCDGCVHYFREADRQFVCRRYPPTWALMVVPPKVIGQAPDIIKRSAMPGAQPKSTCGEWSPKLAMET